MTTIYEARDPAAGFRAAQQATVSVDGTVIAAADIASEAQHHAAASPLDAWTAAARALVVRRLLLAEAGRLGLTPQPTCDEQGRRETDEEALIRQLVEREVVTPEPDEASCRRYYDNNAARFRAADIYEASHILFAARPEAADPLADARAAAAAVLDELARDPSEFAALARRYSACPSAQAGGNLGQLTRGDTTAAFEAAMMALQPGETTAKPIETPYGLHIIRLERRIDGHVVAFETVSDRIAAYLAERSTRLAVAQYLARLAACAEIVGVELPTPQERLVS